MFIYFPHSGEMKAKIEKANVKWGEAAKRTDAFKTIAWYRLSDAKKKAEARKIKTGKWLSKFTKKPHKWSGNPVGAFVMGKEATEAKNKKGIEKYEKAKANEKDALAAAQEAESRAEAAGFEDENLNAEAKASITKWRDTHLKAGKAKKKTTNKPYNQIGYLIGLGVFFAIFFGIGTAAMGRPVGQFLVAFIFVYLITVLAFVASSQATMKHYGIGYAAWAIIFGMLISNTIGTPKWAMPAVQTEYYIKTGLVLLGAKILFEKIIVIGTLGHVCLRCIGRDSNRSRLQGKERGVDSRGRALACLHIYHDDCDADYYKGYFPC
jgi:hypothetical protein